MRFSNAIVNFVVIIVNNLYSVFVVLLRTAPSDPATVNSAVTFQRNFLQGFIGVFHVTHLFPDTVMVVTSDTMSIESVVSAASIGNAEVTALVLSSRRHGVELFTGEFAVDIPTGHTGIVGLPVTIVSQWRHDETW